MAPYIKNSTFRLQLSLARLYAHLVNTHSEICELTSIALHKLHPALLKNLNARELPVPIAFYHPDRMGPGPGPAPASLSSNLGEDFGAARHRLDATPFSRLSIWAYLALAFVILAVVSMFSYMLYSCYHTAGLRVRVKTGTGLAVGAGGVKGGWQNLEDPSGETVIERGEGSRLTKDQDVVGEKADVAYLGEYKADDSIHPWNERSGLGLKGLGIKLERSPNLQYFTSHPDESQASMIPGSPHSTCSLGSTSDHEHEQDLESSDGSDCPSMSARPLAHSTERTATPFGPPLPLPLPLPATPSPPTQKHQVKQNRTRLRALTQILAHNLNQNHQGREVYFELQPMIPQTEDGAGDQSETPPNESSPLSAQLSSSQFAFFAPYPNFDSTSSNLRSNLISNASNSWGNNSGSPTATSTPLTPITPISPVTPTKPGPLGVPAAELRFDSNNIQFIETPARNCANSGAEESSPESLDVLAAASSRRAEMLWNDPKLSPVQGVPLDLDEEKASLVKEDNPTELAVGKTRAAGVSKLKAPAATVWQAILSRRDLAPTLAAPDQVQRGNRNLRLGYMRHNASLSSPSPSSHYSDDSSAFSSPSIVTAKFLLDRGELKKDNLRNKDRVGLGKGKKEKILSPIPRPVFLPHPQPSRCAEPF